MQACWELKWKFRIKSISGIGREKMKTNSISVYLFCQSLYRRTHPNRSIILAGVLALALGASQAAAESIPISMSLPQCMTAQDFNALVALVATQDDLAAVADLADFGPVYPQTIGTWGGTVTGSSWNLSLSGQFNGIPLTITEDGVLNTNTSVASWTDTGSYGTSVFSGSGSLADDGWTLSDVCFLSGLVLDQSTGIISVFTGGAGGAIASQVNALGHVIINDARVRPLHPTKSHPNQLLYSSWSGSLPSNNAPISLLQTGSLNPPTSAFQVTATVTPTPEPPSAILLASALAILWGWQRKRFKQMARGRV
jgi:hypothetical protein